MKRKTALYGLLVALAFIFGYVEMLVPVPVGIPGIKLGLANGVTLEVLYLLRPRDALAVSLIRILLTGLTFGSPASMLYSLCGGMLSAALMALLHRSHKLSCVGVSMLGGLTHNVAQLCVAIVIVDSLSIAFYLPVLLATGALTGFVIGSLALPITRISLLQKYK